MSQIDRHKYLLLLAFFVLAYSSNGCDKPSDADFSPVMERVDPREEEASEFKHWTPTADQAAALAAMKDESSGVLAKLLTQSRWDGSRLRVTGIRDGLPVTEAIGPWHIALVPLTDSTLIELKGLLFAKQHSVKLDIKREVLLIDDAEFQGTPIRGESPMFQNMKFEGLAFEKEIGRILGTASIVALEDGRIAMDFHNILINGVAAREYGELKPAPIPD